MSIRKFISKNLIAIVMVPVLIGGHYTWYTLQHDDRLVSAEERRKLPFSSLIFGNRRVSMTSYEWSENPEISEYDDADYKDYKWPSYTGEDFFYHFM